MLKVKLVLLGFVALFVVLSCNDGILPARSLGVEQGKKDRSQRTVIDNQPYIDFTVREFDARSIKIEDFLSTLNNGTFKNGNSTIKIKSQEGAVEFSSDSGNFEGKQNCQIYGKFSVEIKAASSDCLYVRKNPGKEGFVMIDGVMFNDEAVPDLAVCLPLYGFSRNRIEVSPVMNGFIVMPSGTYWKQ